MPESMLIYWRVYHGVKYHVLSLSFLEKYFFLDEFTGMMGIGLGYNDDYDEHAMTCAWLHIYRYIIPYYTYMHDHACIFITTDLRDVASDDGRWLG